MKTNATLNRLYMDYSAGRLEKKKFEGIVFKAIYKKFPRLPGLGKEDYEDFISGLYPRISRAVDNYSEMGSAFDVYINTAVLLSAKEYRMRQARGYNAEAAAWVTQIPEMFAHEREPGIPDFAEAVSLRAKRQGKARNSRQLLILALKCCRYISDDFLERISRRLDMDPEALRKMLDHLNESRARREARAESFRNQVNSQFCRCLYYERNLRSLQENPIAAQRMKKKIENSRSKLCRMRERLSRLPLDPSNAQIAALLGITKGAVDAVLHTLKTRGKTAARADAHLPN